MTIERVRHHRRNVGRGHNNLRANNRRVRERVGKQLGGIGAGTSSYPMLTFMGRAGGPSSSAMGSMGPAMIYNRAITDAEIIQNYNAIRGRYGI